MLWYLNSILFSQPVIHTRQDRIRITYHTRHTFKVVNPTMTRNRQRFRLEYTRRSLISIHRNLYQVRRPIKANCNGTFSILIQRRKFSIFKGYRESTRFIIFSRNMIIVRKHVYQGILSMNFNRKCNDRTSYRFLFILKICIINFARISISRRTNVQGIRHLKLYFTGNNPKEFLLRVFPFRMINRLCRVRERIKGTRLNTPIRSRDQRLTFMLQDLPCIVTSLMPSSSLSKVKRR